MLGPGLHNSKNDTARKRERARDRHRERKRSISRDNVQGLYLFIVASLTQLYSVITLKVQSNHNKRSAPTRARKYL